jgi:hypothetical protein
VDASENVPKGSKVRKRSASAVVESVCWPLDRDLMEAAMSCLVFESAPEPLKLSLWHLYKTNLPDCHFHARFAHLGFEGSTHTIPPAFLTCANELGGVHPRGVSLGPWGVAIKFRISWCAELKHQGAKEGASSRVGRFRFVGKVKPCAVRESGVSTLPAK